MKLETLEDKVRAILVQSETARADDMLLYAEYVYRELRENGVTAALGEYISKVFLDRKFRIINGISGTESIRRCRQKIQEKYPELKPSERMVELRKEEEKRYRDYARGKK